MSLSPGQLMHAAMLALTRMNVVYGARAAPIRRMTSTAYSPVSGRLDVEYVGRAEPASFEYAADPRGAVSYTCLGNRYVITFTPAAGIYEQTG